MQARITQLVNEGGRLVKNLACNRAAARSSLACAMADTMLVCMSTATSVYIYRLSRSILHFLLLTTESNFPSWCKIAYPRSFSYIYWCTQLDVFVINGNTHIQLRKSLPDLRPLNTSCICLVSSSVHYDVLGISASRMHTSRSNRSHQPAMKDRTHE